MSTKLPVFFYLTAGISLVAGYACNRSGEVPSDDGASVVMDIPQHGLSDDKAKDIKYVLTCSGQSFTANEKDIKGQMKLEFTGTDKVPDGSSCSLQIRGVISESFLKSYTWPEGYKAGSEQAIFESGSSTLAQRRLKVVLRQKYSVSDQNSFVITVKKVIVKEQGVSTSSGVTFTNVTCPDVNIRPEGAQGLGPVSFKLPKNAFGSSKECTFTAETKSPTVTLQGKLNISSQYPEYETLELWKSSVTSQVSGGTIEVEATIEGPRP